MARFLAVGGGMKRGLNTASTASGRYYVNRDGRVNVLDLGVAKANLNHGLATPSAPAVTAGTANAEPVPAAAPFATGPLLTESAASSLLEESPGSILPS
jgi:hypothetical protein